ncbi:CRISPR-associated protein Cas1 [Lachnospiraceae bacterium TWA4]|nr:CRISPR-associated protein Cas1 [Lachnospiraceae bacterium TWA4]
MAVIYVKEQGSLVRRKGNRIEITKGSISLFEYPILYMDSLVLLGNIQLSTQALHLLLESGIDIVYMTLNGRYLGHTAAENSKNVFLRLAQYQCYEDLEFRMGLARRIVNNKISNQLAVIRTYRWKSGDKQWKEDSLKIQEYQKRLINLNSSQEIMGIEGICSSIYFGCFGRMLKSEFVFNNRNRRPPKDPVNAVLSLTYTFLTHELESLLEAESFETCLGFLHGIRYGRKSLALDLVEEFRQPIADRMVLQSFNKKMFNKHDFKEDEMLLTEDGFRKFCKIYEKWMTQSRGEKKQNFRTVLKIQIKALKQTFQKGIEYQPFMYGDEEYLE